MTPIDIRPADLETVRRILGERVPTLEVHAFGSRVAWNARETSDLDLALMTDEPLGIDRTAELRAAFTDSDLPFRVDIVDWATASESFRKQIRRMFVTLPPLAEQRAIADVLGTLDEKIELNRQLNATLEAMARALFRSWFVDFDPVRAKLAGRDTGLPKAIVDLFPDRLVDSELGEIPEGWPVVPLPELIEVNPSRSLRKGEIAPYLDMASMPTRSHAPDSVVRRPFNSGMRFTNGDTLVARITPCLENGKTAFVDFLSAGEIGWGSTEFIVLKPKHRLPGEFAYLMARSPRFREFAIQNMSGTSGRQRVPARALSGFSLPSPPARVGAEFGRAIRMCLGRTRAAADECRLLTNCRDALLPKLISGELRAPVRLVDAEMS